MESLRRWSLGGLFREVPGRGNDLHFRYPSRLEAAGFLFIAAVGLLGKAFWLLVDPSRDLGTRCTLATLGLLVFLITLTGFHRLWNQRVLMLNRTDRRLTYIRRTPLGTRREVLGFDQLLRVQVTCPADLHLTDCDSRVDVLLVASDESRIFLGQEVRDGAIQHGKRLAQLMGLPLQFSQPDRIASR